MAEITYTAGISTEVRAAIEPHLAKWAHIIPAWCHEVTVTWEDDELDGALDITVHSEYRRADLRVLPNFLSCVERREQAVVHELLHIMTEPMRNVARDLRDVVARDHPALKEWAEEVIRHSNESVTCDLTALVMAHCAHSNRQDR